MSLPSDFDLTRIDLADTLCSELEDEAAPDTNAPILDPAKEPMAGDVIGVHGIIAMSLVPKVLLAGIVLALLVFVLRQRRRSTSQANEKGLA
jgi:hypothetical protein